jgi:hypothetical protein
MIPFLLRFKQHYAAIANGMHQCPLWVKSGHVGLHEKAAALKADILRCG